MSSSSSSFSNSSASLAGYVPTFSASESSRAVAAAAAAAATSSASLSEPGLSYSRNPQPTQRYISQGPIARDRISYFYDDVVAGIHYGRRHPMKPQRMALTNELVLAFGVYERLEMYVPRWATDEELRNFHVSDYIEFLRGITPENASSFAEQLKRFNIAGHDCPVFNDLFKFCRISAGGSLEAARRINTGLSDIAINWSGGLHHAKKREASGFCYVNDIVLAILELLRFNQRVLYVDIDIHHGDGVQEAFYNTSRVMTVSFHRYGPTGEGNDFFPGSGSINEYGIEDGRYYAINVPLKAGMDDASYIALFRAVMDRVMDVYRPGAVVLQCGADSLGLDRIGCFSLSIKGHAECVRHMKRYNVPMIVLGGGGYTVRNVARCWAYETAVLVNAELPASIPSHAYTHFYAPDYSMFPDISAKVPNENTWDDLQGLQRRVFEHLRYIEHAPSVQMQLVPPCLLASSSDDGWAVERETLESRVSDLKSSLRNAAILNSGRSGSTYTNLDYYSSEQDHD